MKKHKQEFFKIHQFKRRYDAQQGKFIINIAYETATEPTSRTIAVAEAFGLGLDQNQKFVIYDNVELKIGENDIVYITGDSGSGKSVLLKAIRHDLNEKAIDLTEIKPEPNKPIIDTVGRNFSEGLDLLSKVGLNDAFLFVRRFEELSDGQKYRYKITKLMESEKEWWLADEFCSTLDRDTAKIVAFNIQKFARLMGKAVIVATTHMDLFEDLKPNVYVHKRFGKEITVNYFVNASPKECSLVKEMRVEEGNIKDYRKLSIFHYRSTCCPPPRKIFTLKRSEELCGVIVYSYPSPICFGRSKVLKESFEQLQRDVSIISRVIIHPKYRSIGLGVKLVRETLSRVGTPFVEALAVMAKYNPFFEKAGMRKIVESKPNANLLHSVERLHELGFELSFLNNVKENLRLIEFLGRSKVLNVLKELSRREGSLRKRLLALDSVYPSHREFLKKLYGASDEDLAVILKRLAFLVQSKVYLFWSKDGFERK